jgi:RNA polymerase sigma-70 factor (ECF subfamily)
VDRSDPILLARIAAGDRAAFAAFYDRYSSRIYGLLIKLLKIAREADDVLLEPFWQVWTRASQFDARRGSPLAWLVLIARSRCLDQLRRGSRQRVNPADFDEPSTTLDLADDLHRDEIAQRARQAIATLPDDQRIAIQLAFYGGYTHQEIAEQLNAALGTIKTRIRLGMQKLREALVGVDEPAFSPEVN